MGSQIIFARYSTGDLERAENHISPTKPLWTVAFRNDPNKYVRIFSNVQYIDRSLCDNITPENDVIYFIPENRFKECISIFDKIPFIYNNLKGGEWKKKDARVPQEIRTILAETGIPPARRELIDKVNVVATLKVYLNTETSEHGDKMEKSKEEIKAEILDHFAAVVDKNNGIDAVLLVAFGDEEENLQSILAESKKSDNTERRVNFKENIEKIATQTHLLFKETGSQMDGNCEELLLRLNNKIISASVVQSLSKEDEALLIYFNGKGDDLSVFYKSTKQSKKTIIEILNPLQYLTSLADV